MDCCCAQRVFTLKGEAFSNQLDSSSDPLERAIAEELWRWQASSVDDRAMVLSDQSRLASALEWFLCSGFGHKNSARSSGWWCDGAINLSVRQFECTAFQVEGIAIWAELGKRRCPFYLAPFELEFYYSSPGDLCSSRVIVRFGQTDDDGHIVKTPYSKGYGYRIGRRPKTDSQWAFAIELS